MKTNDLTLLNYPDKWGFLFADDLNGIKPARYPLLKKWVNKNTDNHSHIEILMGLEGDSYYGVADRIYEIKKGDIFVLTNGINHQNAYPGFYPDVTHLWISFLHGQVFCRFIKVRNGTMQFAPDDAVFLKFNEIGLLPELYHQTILREHNLYEKCERQLIFRGIICLVFSALLRKISEKCPDPVPVSGDKWPKMIKNIQNYIKANAGRDISLDRLENIFGYSKFHLLRVFKNMTGMTVQEWIDHCRVDYTVEKLSCGKSKKQIGIDLGFSCPASFSRWLKTKNIQS